MLSSYLAIAESTNDLLVEGLYGVCCLSIEPDKLFAIYTKSLWIANVRYEADCASLLNLRSYQISDSDHTVYEYADPAYPQNLIKAIGAIADTIPSSNRPPIRDMFAKQLDIVKPDPDNG